LDREEEKGTQQPRVLAAAAAVPPRRGRGRPPGGRHRPPLPARGADPTHPSCPDRSVVYQRDKPDASQDPLSAPSADSDLRHDTRNHRVNDAHGHGSTGATHPPQGYPTLAKRRINKHQQIIPPHLSPMTVETAKESFFDTLHRCDQQTGSLIPISSTVESSSSSQWESFKTWAPNESVKNMLMQLKQCRADLLRRYLSTFKLSFFSLSLVYVCV
jgi:hypothetical protein